MPMDTAIRRPCRRASYSAILLESVYMIWSTYWTVSPVGDVRTTPAPSPANILEPSKCIIQFECVELGLRPFCDEVGQKLRFNSSPWLIGYIEQEDLDGP